MDLNCDWYVKSTCTFALLSKPVGSFKKDQKEKKSPEKHARVGTLQLAHIAISKDLRRQMLKLFSINKGEIYELAVIPAQECEQAHRDL